MKKYIKQLELFLRGSNFDRGIRLGVSVGAPLVLFYFLGFAQYAAAVAVGAFLNAPVDIPGSKTRKINTILINTALAVLVTASVLFSKPVLPVLLVVLACISFGVSLISVYGFRASLVSFSGLLALVLAFAIQKETAGEILIQVLLMAAGGIWYLGVSTFFHWLAPKKDQNQLLSDTLQLIGEYLKLRAKLLTKKKKREACLKEILNLQHQINDKHEILREVLLASRRRSGRSNQEEKQLLIFLSSINIFELIEAKHLDYQSIDRIFGKRKQFLKASKRLNKVMGNHLILLSELLIQRNEIPTNDILLKALNKANDSILKYRIAVKLPEAREGALVLRNLYDYQEQIVHEIRSIRRVMTNAKEAAKSLPRRQASRKFLTIQDYSINVFLHNLNFNSVMFRHALRLSAAVIFAYLLGFLFNLQNTYWILLTIVVIMRPSYGLTKERSKDRIIGTLIGAAFAVGIVLLTQSVVLYSVLAFLALILAFSLIQQNYKSAAALITVSIIFLYSLINPNAFEVIQYRVIDTLIGSAIAVIANYLLFPTWEINNLKQLLTNALKKDNSYLLETQALYENPGNKLAYNLARKEAFLASSNLNASFQRLTQDPKSKQKEFQLIYEIVTLNQTIISAIASIGNFITNHKTTPPSSEFKGFINILSRSLLLSRSSLESFQGLEKLPKEAIDKPQEKLQLKYQELATLRDENIQLGKTELDTETLHGLQEAYLITSHLSWLKSLTEKLNDAIERYRDILLVDG